MPSQAKSKNLSVNHLRPVLLLWHLLRLLSLSIKAVQVQFLSVNSISVCPAKSTGNFAVALGKGEKSFGLVAGKRAADSGHECGADSRTRFFRPNTG